MKNEKAAKVNEERKKENKKINENEK